MKTTLICFLNIFIIPIFSFHQKTLLNILLVRQFMQSLLCLAMMHRKLRASEETQEEKEQQRKFEEEKLIFS